MAQETILFVQGIEMPPDVLELAHSLMPTGFALRMVPPRARSGEIAEAMREVHYVLGFVFHLPDEAYLNAHNLNQLQVVSVNSPW
jgi:hypothetical protein